MKKNFLIVLFLTIAQMGAFYIKSNGQYSNRISNIVSIKTDTIWEIKPVLIADETTITYTKTEAIITCDNDTIFKKIHETHSQLFKRFTCTWIHRKSNPYKHYVIYMDKADSQILITWAKKNL